MARIQVTVDGVKYADEVEARLLLVHYLRDNLGQVGTPIGCDTSNCGSCTVHVDGVSVKSCTMLAVQADGTDITTIQGIGGSGGKELHPMQKAFHENHALQCGYCTPGMLLAALDLLRAGGVPSRDAIREHLSGNYCRCTGYQAIVDAVESTARARTARARTAP